MSRSFMFGERRLKVDKSSKHIHEVLGFYGSLLGILKQIRSRLLSINDGKV